jgi:hypothetical protein
MRTNQQSNYFKRSYDIEAFANNWLNAGRGSLQGVWPLNIRGALQLSTP